LGKVADRFIGMTDEGRFALFFIPHQFRFVQQLPPREAVYKPSPWGRWQTGLSGWRMRVDLYYPSSVSLRSTASPKGSHFTSLPLGEGGRPVYRDDGWGSIYTIPHQFRFAQQLPPREAVYKPSPWGRWQTGLSGWRMRVDLYYPSSVSLRSTASPKGSRL